MVVVMFDKLMVTCLTKFHEEFHYHLLGKGMGATDADAVPVIERVGVR